MSEEIGTTDSTEPADPSRARVLALEGGGVVKAWIEGVPVADNALEQLRAIGSMPFIHRWVAAMPDVHLGRGAAVGTVIPTRDAIIPAAVGVDLGCGMMAVQTSLTASDLPDDLRPIRHAIEKAVPHGRTHHGSRNDQGSWGRKRLPRRVERAWRGLKDEFKQLCDRMPRLERANHVTHLGTLGTGNHFIEVCLDEAQRVWCMLHSGSRGVGNRIGTMYISLARKDMRRHLANLPNEDLAYFTEGSEHFEDYVTALGWAQRYARTNRRLMMEATLEALASVKGMPRFETHQMAVNCHHNYVELEEHFGEEVWVTRKGAVRAGKGELGIIPGSMGARSYIVRGKGNPESFCSCSHGAGRTMSRTQARKRISLDEHARATAHVECRKDREVLDESPAAYKPIEQVMAAQSDLVEVVHTLRQVVCIKG